jgi:glycosyltransferase involved in cell wall biosynthesis
VTNVLAIGREAPWLGPRSGVPIRRDALVRGASRVGAVDYVMLTSAVAPATEPPPSVRSVTPVETRARRTGVVGHAGWQLASTLHRDEPPYELSRLRLAHPDRAASTLRALLGTHDVVWLLDKHAAYLVRSLLDDARVPVLLDVEEQLAERFRQEATLLRASRPSRLGERASAWARLASLERNVRAWDGWTQRLADLATVCTVSNPADVDALAPRPTVVIPNGCRLPPPRAPKAARADRPVLVFHGFMGYPPNADAAAYLVAEVIPQLERVIGPEFEVRIVGKATPSVEALTLRDPRVVVTGYVDDITSEVRGADVIVVPLRMGTGTRIKVLEALAECTPVVSTSIGCEGLGVTDGEQLLVADGAAAFAAACARALRDSGLRARLVEQGYRLAEHFDWDVIEERVADLTRAQVEAP